MQNDRSCISAQILASPPATGATATDRAGGSGGADVPPAFCPTSSDELAEWYLAHPDATLIAGATDVGLWVTKNLRDLSPVAFLNRVTDLQHIERQGGLLHVGAGVTIAALRAAVAANLPSFAELLRRYASEQVRNAATIGGNIANGSPIGDGPPALIALGATLHLRRGDEMRSMPLESFFLDYRKQDRRPGEFVAGISFPNKPPRCAATRSPNASIRTSLPSAVVSTSRSPTAASPPPASPLAAWRAFRNARQPSKQP